MYMLVDEFRQAAKKCTTTLHPLKYAYNGLKENIKGVTIESLKDKSHICIGGLLGKCPLGQSFV